MDKAIQLLNQFTDSQEKKDTKAAAEFKKQIMALSLQTESEVIACFRLGFSILYKEKNLGEAMAIFKKITEDGIKCDDFYQAIITYGICLWSMQKHSQAIFELRKALSNVPTNSVHELLALDYLSLFLKDNKVEQKQIEEIVARRISVLQHLIQKEDDPETLSAFNLELATALIERNKEGDFEQARVFIQKVIDVGSEISEDTVENAKAILKLATPPKESTKSKDKKPAKSK